MTSHRGWLTAAAGIGCIFCSSAGMLIATDYNRSGGPVSTLNLSERELGLPADDGNSGEDVALAFRLRWRVEAMGHSEFGSRRASATRVVWMTPQKRAALGIKSTDDIRLHSIVAAFLVLEFNGRAYARELQRSCRGDDDLDSCNRVRQIESRLYVIDAGTDADLLRRTYSDTTTYAIVRGTVRFDAAPDHTDPEAYIDGLDVDTVQAVEPLRSAKSKESGEMSWRAVDGGQPFSAAIAFGRRLEPWNLSVSFGPRTMAPVPSLTGGDDGWVDVKPGQRPE